LQKLYDECGEDSFQFVILKKCLVQDLLKWEKYFKDLHKETVFNINDIVKTKKKKRVGKKSKNHKQKFRELFSGENNPNCQNSIDTIIQIKVAIRNGMKNKDIALMFGKNDAYISKIKNGYRWADVEIPKDYVLFEISYSNEQVCEYEKK
jgi:hypothetical protein